MTVKEYIVVDDDHVNNLICKTLLITLFPEANVLTFTNPLKCLEHLPQRPDKNDSAKVILFLDINMPEMSGWDFVDKFSELHDSLKKQIDIYILSSSIHPGDIRTAEDNRYIMSFLSKPLTKEKVKGLLNQ